MGQKIQYRRGPKATIPTLDLAEPGLTTDTNEPFIGGTTGNIQLAKTSDLTAYAKKSGDGVVFSLSGGYKVQSGSTSFPNQTYSANTIYTQNVTFPTQFNTSPIVIVSSIGIPFGGNVWLLFDAENATITGFSCKMITSGGTGQPGFNWYAIGT